MNRLGSQITANIPLLILLSMSVHIRVAGALKEHTDRNVTLDGVHSVAEALSRLALPPDMGVVIMVNGRLATWQTPLQDGDLVHVVPVAAGGTIAGVK